VSRITAENVVTEVRKTAGEVVRLLAASDGAALIEAEKVRAHEYRMMVVGPNLVKLPRTAPP
jgi:hypothetical protein